MTEASEGAKRLSAKMAADITELHHRSVRTIKAAILADFVEFAEGIEHDRGQSTSVQDVLFAPSRSQSNRFTTSVSSALN